MKRILQAVLCLAVPGLLLLNSWEGYRYNALMDQVASLERQQDALLEANRDAIAQIAYETSPERVAEKGAGFLGLQPLGSSAVTRLQVGTGAAEGPAQ